MDRISEKISNYAASLKFTDLTPEALKATKKSFIDAIGCGLGAFAGEPIKVVRGIASAITSSLPASLLGTRLKSSMEMAAFVNGSMVRYLDYNDAYIGKDGPHPSDCIGAMLSAADALHADGKTLALSIALAYEIIEQLADSAEFAKRGWDNVTELTLGATVGVGKIMGLSKYEMAQALALAVVPNITLGQTRVGELTMWKGCAGPYAIKNGLFAALLAWKGLTGPVDVFEGARGLCKQVTGPFELKALGESGRKFKIEETYFKPLPVVYTALLPIETAMALRDKVDISSVESIKIYLDDFCVKEGGHAEKWDPQTRETADHSIPYLTVAALVDGAISEKTFTPERFRDPKVLAILKKLTLEEDPQFTKEFPKTFNCRIEVTGKGGQKWSEHLKNPKGHPARPMTEADVEKKFRELTGAVLIPKQAQNALDMMWHLEDLKDVSQLLEALVV